MSRQSKAWWRTAGWRKRQSREWRLPGSIVEPDIGNPAAGRAGLGGHHEVEGVGLAGEQADRHHDAVIEAILIRPIQQRLQVGAHILVRRQIGIALTADPLAEPGIGAWQPVFRAFGQAGGRVEDRGETTEHAAAVGLHRIGEVIAAVWCITQVGAHDLGVGRIGDDDRAIEVQLRLVFDATAALLRGGGGANQDAEAKGDRSTGRDIARPDHLVGDVGGTATAGPGAGGDV